MSNNVILAMTALVILGIIILMVLNFAPKITPNLTAPTPPPPQEEKGSKGP